MDRDPSPSGHRTLPALQSTFRVTDDALHGATLVHETHRALPNSMLKAMQEYLTEVDGSAAELPPSRSRGPTTAQERSPSTRHKHSTERSQRRVRPMSFTPDPKAPTSGSFASERSPSKLMQAGVIHHRTPTGPKLAKPSEDSLSAGMYAGWLAGEKVVSERDEARVAFNDMVLRYRASRLPCGQWCDLLLAEVNRISDPALPRPTALRTAAALLVFDRATDTLGIPRDFLDDLLAATVGKGSGLVKLRDASRKEAHATQSFMDSTFTFEVLRDTQATLKAIEGKTREVAAGGKLATQRMEETEAENRKSRLRLAFTSWRNTLRQESWRKAARWLVTHRDRVLIKTRCFRQWRVFVANEKCRDQITMWEERSRATEKEMRDAVFQVQYDADHRVRELKKEHKAELKKRGNIVDVEEERRREEEYLNLQAELGSLHHRNNEMEVMVKSSKAERDRLCQQAAGSSASVRRALGMVVANRHLGGLKAADVVVNGENYGRGETKGFRYTSIDTADILNTPIRTKGQHILLAFVNAVVERQTGIAPNITNLASGMCDGEHYATLLEHIVPRSRAASMMRAAPDSVTRMTILVDEGSSMMKENEVPSATTAASTATRRRSTLLERTRSRMEARDTGPIAAAGVTPIDLVEGSEAAHLVAVHFMLHLYHAHYCVGDPEQVVIGASVSVVDGEVSISAGEAECDATQLYLVHRSESSWQSLLRHVDEDLMVVVYRLAKGELAKNVVRDAREDAILSRFVVDSNFTQDDTDALSLEAPISDKESAVRSLLRVAPIPKDREQVVTVAQLHTHLIHEVFEHFSGRKPVMSQSRFDVFVEDCGARDLLPDGAQPKIFKECALYHPADGLHPPEFLVALVTLAKYIGPPALRTISAKLENFVLHHLVTRMKISSSAPMRKVMESPDVVAVVNAVEPGLRAFFLGVASVTPDASEEKSLSKQNFLKIMKDLGFVDAKSDIKEVSHIFDCSQDAFDTSGMNLMSFPEFVEAVAALGLIRVSHPYLPPSARINTFIMEKLIPSLRRKYPSHYSTMLAAMKMTEADFQKLSRRFGAAPVVVFEEESTAAAIPPQHSGRRRSSVTMISP